MSFCLTLFSLTAFEAVRSNGFFIAEFCSPYACALHLAIVRHLESALSSPLKPVEV
jgi:hypothetical protein